MEITKRMVEEVQKLGDTASMNMFIGAVYTVAKLNPHDRILQNKYKSFIEVIRRCQKVERQKKTNTEEYKKDLTDSNTQAKNLLGYLMVKRYIKPKA